MVGTLLAVSTRDTELSIALNHQQNSVLVAVEVTEWRFFSAGLIQGLKQERWLQEEGTSMAPRSSRKLGGRALSGELTDTEVLVNFRNTDLRVTSSNRVSRSITPPFRGAVPREDPKPNFCITKNQEKKHCIK